jgi:hypothetical protein
MRGTLGGRSIDHRGIEEDVDAGGVRADHLRTLADLVDQPVDIIRHHVAADALHCDRASGRARTMSRTSA